MSIKWKLTKQTIKDKPSDNEIYCDNAKKYCKGKEDQPCKTLDMDTCTTLKAQKSQDEIDAVLPGTLTIRELFQFQPVSSVWQYNSCQKLNLPVCNHYNYRSSPTLEKPCQLK